MVQMGFSAGGIAAFETWKDGTVQHKYLEPGRRLMRDEGCRCRTVRWQRRRRLRQAKHWYVLARLEQGRHPGLSAEFDACAAAHSPIPQQSPSTLTADIEHKQPQRAIPLSTASFKAVADASAPSAASKGKLMKTPNTMRVYEMFIEAILDTDILDSERNCFSVRNTFIDLYCTEDGFFTTQAVLGVA